MAELRTLPLLPLRGMMVFPYMMVHLDVGRERSMAALEQAMVGDDREIMLTAQIDGEVDAPGQDDLYQVEPLPKSVSSSRCLATQCACW